MNHLTKILLFIMICALPIFAQTQVKDTKEKPNEEIESKPLIADKDKILQIETNLKQQQKELEELKKIYGMKGEEKVKTSDKENSEESYVSPLKKNGLTAEYNRSIFLDPPHGKKFNIDQKPWLNDWIRIGAYIRPRYEDRYNLGFDKQNKSYVSRFLQTSQIFFLIDPSPYFTMKVTFQDARVLGGSTVASSGDSRAPTFAAVGNTVTPQGATIPSQTTVREAWFMLKKLPFDAKLQLGRQIAAYGDQRIIGSANWTINGLSFDGARFMIDKDNLNLHFFGYKLATNQSGTNGVLSASAPTSYTDPVTGKSSVTNPGLPTQYLVGTYDTFKYKDWFLIDAYSLGILTQKTPSYAGVTLTNPPMTIPATADSDLYNNPWSKQKNDLWTTGFRITNRTVGNNVAANSPWSGWDWTFEAAWQSGATGAKVNKNPTLNSALNSTIDQTIGTTNSNYNLLTQNQKYTGNFYVFQTGYTFFERLRIGAQFWYASGDSNRTDGSQSTFQTLPNPRFSSIPYWNNVSGLSENLGQKNLISKTLNISYKTESFGSFYFSYFVNDKAKTQDAWYAISGAANTGSSTEFNRQGQTTITLANSGRRIYSEIDFTWMYNINDYVSLWVGGGVLTAGNSIKNQKNAAYSYDLKTNQIVTNVPVLLGQNGVSQNAHMFFMQLNAAF